MLKIHKNISLKVLEFVIKCSIRVLSMEVSDFIYIIDLIILPKEIL